MSTRHTIAIAVLLFSAAGAALAQAPQGPSNVTNDAFSITLPAGFTAFTNQTKSADSPEGKVDTTTWVAKSPAGQAVIVALTKMPGKILDPDKMNASTRDALVKSVNGTVETDTKLTGDTTGENLLFKGNTAPVFARAELIVSGNRQYQVIFIGHSDADRTAAPVTAMFDSFKATAQTTTTTATTSSAAAATSTSTTMTTTTTNVATSTAATTTSPKQ